MFSHFISFPFKDLIMFSQLISKKDPLVGLAGKRGKIIFVIIPEPSPLQGKIFYHIFIPSGEWHASHFSPPSNFFRLTLGGKYLETLVKIIIQKHRSIIKLKFNYNNRTCPSAHLTTTLTQVQYNNR